MVLRILCKLNSSKDTGLDMQSPRFVKDGAALTVSPLTHILNLSLKSGELPDDIKSDEGDVHSQKEHQII